MTETSAIQADMTRDKKKREDNAASAQDVNPDLILTEPGMADRNKPVKLFSFTMPKPIADLAYTVEDGISTIRYHALKTLPDFIVNNSSNAIGATQLVGEALYFKSSGVNQFIKNEHKGTWKAFVYPPVNVVEGVFKKSAFKIQWKDLLNPTKTAEELGRFFDLEEAGKIDLARDGKLSNRWSARSGFAGMFSMTVATLFPDEKDDPSTKEKMMAMATHNPLGYVGYRLGKGVMFPVTAATRFVDNLHTPKENHHMGDGKREFAGIGMTLTGIFSVLAGFRQPRVLGSIAKYDFNPWQMLGGMITTFAGGQLMLGVDNQQGWTNYGATQFWRLAVLPQSIRERFKDKQGFADPNAGYYFGAQGVFQTKNLVAVSIGGAQKLPDGTILDQKKLRETAKDKIEGERKSSPIFKDEAPTNKVQGITEHTLPDKSAVQAV